jgi:hypothetical protein
MPSIEGISANRPVASAGPQDPGPLARSTPVHTNQQLSISSIKKDILRKIQEGNGIPTKSSTWSWIKREEDVDMLDKLYKAKAESSKLRKRTADKPTPGDEPDDGTLTGIAALAERQIALYQSGLLTNAPEPKLIDASSTPKAADGLNGLFG